MTSSPHRSVELLKLMVDEHFNGTLDNLPAKASRLDFCASLELGESDTLATRKELLQHTLAIAKARPELSTGNILPALRFAMFVKGAELAHHFAPHSNGTPIHQIEGGKRTSDGVLRAMEVIRDKDALGLAQFNDAELQRETYELLIARSAIPFLQPEELVASAGQTVAEKTDPVAQSPVNPHTRIITDPKELLNALNDTRSLQDSFSQYQEEGWRRLEVQRQGARRDALNEMNKIGRE